MTAVILSDAVAGRIVRAEAPIIRANTHLQGRITIHCGLATCTIRAYTRSTDRLAKTIRLRCKPVKRHQQRVLEDYSGWVTISPKTSLYLDTLSVR